MRAWLAAGLLFLAHPLSAETFTDSAGRTVTVPTTVNKVLAAGPPASVVLYTLAPDKLLGWVRRPDDDAKAYLAKPYRELPAQLRLTGREPADPAAIKALGAGLIVDFGTVDGRYAGIAERTQAATGIAYVLIDGALGRTATAYRELGRMMQAGPRAETLAGRSQAMLDEMAARIGGSSRRKVLVVRGPDGDEAYGAGAFTEEIIKPAGGANVAESWGTGIVKQITPAKVREADPDVVIATDPFFLETVGRNPDWKQVPAIAGGRLYAAPRQPFGWLDEPPSVNRLIGLRWLAGLLHPQRFDGDLRETVRAFYSLFYQVDLSPAQLDTLLANGR